MYGATPEQPQAGAMRAPVPLQVPIPVDSDQVIVPHLPGQNRFKSLITSYFCDLYTFIK